MPGANAVDAPLLVALPPQPYPGLRPFTKAEWPIFFGRERMADRIVAELLEKRLLVVHGDSGCGKSSVVAAAVLPRLEQESARGGLRWITCSTQPGDSPLWNLSSDLAPLAGGGDAAIEIRRRLNFGSAAPAEIAALVRGDSNACVCILIDQFEELFACAERGGAHEAQLVTSFLSAFHEHPPDGLYIVLTMRSEFLGACARFEGFAEVVNAAQYLLPRLQHDDLLRAIREPATLYDGEIARELAERLIADAGTGQDQLPLMQHGLMLLHRDYVLAPARAGDGGSAGPPAIDASAPGAWRLGIEHYTHGGGLKQLLSDHADAVMDEAVRTAQLPPGSRVVEDIFRALTDITADGQAIRRRRTFAQLLAVTGAAEPALRAVVGAFRVEGVSFLRPYGTAEIRDATVVDISHEALIRCWSKIADPRDGWLVREFRNGLIWRSLLVQADSFERDASNVLAPTTTDEREVWLRRRNAAWAERYGGGWPRVLALVEASAAARDAARKEQAAAREREERASRNKRFLVVASAAAAVLIVMLIVAVTLGNRARAALAEKNAALVQYERQLSEKHDQMSRAAEESEKTRAIEEATRHSAEELQKIRDQITGGASSTAQPATRSSAVRQIDALVSQLAATANTPTVAANGPRVYLHIADIQYRGAARDFEQQLEAAQVGDAKIVVPGIELVRVWPPQSVLRCFSQEDCASEARSVLATANRLLQQPQLTLQDMSARYGQSNAIRPHHYEIWFAPGDIRLAGK